VSSVGKYSEFSSATRHTLRSVKPHSVIADRDDEPLALTDRLKSTPADPVQLLSSMQQHPVYQTRSYLHSC